MTTTNDVESFVAGAKGVAVSLVSMPFKDLRHPPIQLGILQSCLVRSGIPARSHSFELAFMEHLHARTADAPDSGEEIRNVRPHTNGGRHRILGDPERA
jgi:hypothetical protein